MRGNKFLIFLGIMAVLLIIVLVFLLFQVATNSRKIDSLKNVTINPVWPYFPEKSEYYLDKDRTWVIKSFQPIFIKYQDTGSDGFLIVNYIEKETGETKEGKIFLTRAIPIIEADGKISSTDRMEYVKQLVVDDQIGIDYLAEIPIDFSMSTPYCSDRENPKVECILANKMQNNKNGDESVFYLMRGYSVLKK